MSALDDAIAAHMAHAAGSMGDPLTDSLSEQQAFTQPARLDTDAPHPALQQADEATALPRGAALAGAAVLLAVLLLSQLYPWGFAPTP
jgi:hypothetical protein